jgi:hypothetical protein
MKPTCEHCRFWKAQVVLGRVVVGCANAKSPKANLSTGAADTCPQCKMKEE